MLGCESMVSQSYCSIVNVIYDSTFIIGMGLTTTYRYLFVSVLKPAILLDLESSTVLVRGVNIGPLLKQMQI